MTILFNFIPVLLFSQNAEQLIKKAEVLFLEGDFEKAAIVFQNALDKKPGDVEILYNLGIAEYKAGHYDNSLKAFESITKISAEPKLKSQSLYNLGNVLLKKGRLQDAINKFKQSLFINPEDGDCRDNLQLAINNLQKSQDEKKKDDNEKQSDKESQENENAKEFLLKDDLDKILVNLQKTENKLKDSLRRTTKVVKKSGAKEW